MAPVIVARDLHKCYAGFAPVLRGVNLEVAPGEMVAIMGPSGCGKSTMLHVLGMLHAPDSGVLEILGQNVLALDHEGTAAFRRGNMGFVMQASNLFDHSTVFENVEFPLIYEQVPPQERWERVIRALELVRLSARVHYRSNRLSGGEQQRVAIARAMVNNPRILLADEPTGALDAKTSCLIMDNFRSLCHTGGVAMVMVTHDPKMADFCDSIYTLEDGLLRCQRHTEPQMAKEGERNLLQGPVPLVRGAMVAERFPELSGQCLMVEAHHMHASGLLSRIYALCGASLWGAPEGYALPLAVRHVGVLRLLASLPGMRRHVRNLSGGLWRLWRALPGRGSGRWWAHCMAFFSGVLLARWGGEEGIGFFYAAGARAPATAAWVASRILHVPFAFAVRAADLAAPGRNWLAKGTDAAFVRCDTEATRLAVAERHPELAEKLVVVRDPLTLMPSDEEQDGSAPPPPANGATPVALLAVGTLAKRKGYDTLLWACGLLRQRNIPFTLTIVGQGPEKLRLRLLAWRLGLRGLVGFAGRVAHENMAAMYQNASIFVAPGHTAPGLEGDGLPSALVEAQTFGLAVVAGQLPGHAEAIEDGVNGCLVPLDDAGALAEVLQALINDPQRRQRLGEAARLSVDKLVGREHDARMVRLVRAACGN